MPITADHIRRTFADYADAHPEERTALAPVFSALERGADLTDRKRPLLHVTAGAVLVNDDGEVLLVHHNATDKWLTPGGHLEREDTDLMGAALRELAEETGVRTGAAPVMTVPVHIDVHAIPANPAKGEGEHRHADVRYLFRVAGEVNTTIQPEEVSGAAWRRVESVAQPLQGRVRAALSVLRSGPCAR